MSGTVQLDETGLHSRECECLRCEAGYRPTETERWRASEALRVRRERQAAMEHETPKQRRARIAREMRREAERAEREREREFLKTYSPPSPAQLAELRAQYPWANKGRKAS